MGGNDRLNQRIPSYVLTPLEDLFKHHTFTLAELTTSLDGCHARSISFALFDGCRITRRGVDLRKELSVHSATHEA